jgi:hypothetical protein
MQIVEYLTENGDSPFAAWFDRLDGQAAAKERWADYKKRKQLERKGRG